MKDRTLRPWYTLIAALLLVAIGGTVWQSFTTLQLHAVHVGWHTPSVLPIIIDAFYVATLAAYIRRPDRFTRLASLSAALVSGAGNALAYLYDPASVLLVAPMPIVIATGLVPPVFAFGIAHFIVHERKAAADAAGHDTGAAVVEPGDHAGGDRANVRPDAAPGGVAQRPKRRAPRQKAAAQNGVSRYRRTSPGDLERAQRVREHGWENVTIPELQGLLGCSYVPAQKARALARNGAGTLAE